MEHITENGYKAVDTLGGIDIYDEYGDYVCELPAVSLYGFMDENDDIDEEKLEEAIHSELEVEGFLKDQAEYC